MNDPAAFAKLVPGFDFLQGLVKNAGTAMPNMGHWIAPTLDPEEIEKRIEELRTVQFWLEQNARMLGATIQALEVQRMTLATLKTMNVSLGDLTESLKIRMPEATPEQADEADERESAAAPAPAPAPKKPAAAESRSADGPAAPIVPPGVPDPLQWWSALTQQFAELATNAMKEGSTDAARNLAGTMVRQGIDAASNTMKKAAAAMPKAAAKPADDAAAAPSDRKAASAKRSPGGASKKPAAPRR